MNEPADLRDWLEPENVKEMGSACRNKTADLLTEATLRSFSSKWPAIAEIRLRDAVDWDVT